MEQQAHELAVAPATSVALEAAFEQTVAAIRRDKNCRHRYRIQRHEFAEPTLICLFCERERK